MIKHLRLPLALLAALAMLLLWSGPASATDLEAGDPSGDTATSDSSQTADGAVVDGQPAVTADDTVADDQTADDDTTDESDSAGSDAEDGNAGAADAGDAALEDAGVGVFSRTITDAAGGLLSGEPAGDGAASGAGEQDVDSDEVVAGCRDALTKAELPGADTCAVIVGCFTLLAAPTDPLPVDEENLADLDDLLTSGTPQEIEDFLGQLFSPERVTAFLACLGSALSPEETGQEAPAAQPVLQPAAAETYYQNCDDARARGAAPVLAGQPGYRPGLDSDSDGIGCENSEGSVQLTSTGATARSGQLAYTGFELTPVLVTAAALLALGGGLLMGARRRS